MTWIDCDANATYAPSERIQGLIRSELRSTGATLAGSLGNPSSLHRGGQGATARIEEARESIRRLVGAAPRDVIVFTSGATEANNTIVFGAAHSSGSLVSTSIEHPCVLGPLARLAERGVKVTLVGPTASGRIEPGMVRDAVDETTAFVSVMAANNETGVVNPVREISRMVRDRAPRAIVHTDAAQLIGKSHVSLDELEVDILTLSAHKLGGLSGVGAIVAREGVPLFPLLIGGPQEGKLRGGTENVLGIAVFGAVAELVREELPQRIARMRSFRDAFERSVLETVPGAEVNGRDEKGRFEDRLPNTSSLFLPGVRADDLVVALDLDGVLVSSGAACSSGKPEPSHVLLAMGQQVDRVTSTIRVSLRDDYSEDAMEYVVSTLARAVKRMRAQN